MVRRSTAWWRCCPRPHGVGSTADGLPVSFLGASVLCGWTVWGPLTQVYMTPLAARQIPRVHRPRGSGCCDVVWPCPWVWGWVPGGLGSAAGAVPLERARCFHVLFRLLSCLLPQNCHLFLS